MNNEQLNSSWKNAVMMVSGDFDLEAKNRWLFQHPGWAMANSKLWAFKNKVATIRVVSTVSDSGHASHWSRPEFYFTEIWR